MKDILIKGILSVVCILLIVFILTMLGMQLAYNQSDAEYKSKLDKVCKHHGGTVVVKDIHWWFRRVEYVCIALPSMRPMGLTKNE